jgi:hypothetical protein
MPTGTSRDAVRMCSERLSAPGDTDMPTGTSRGAVIDVVWEAECSR